LTEERIAIPGFASEIWWASQSGIHIFPFLAPKQKTEEVRTSKRQNRRTWYEGHTQ
jgi:hypothetical protein